MEGIDANGINMTTIQEEVPGEDYLLGDTSEQSPLRDRGECSNDSVPLTSPSCRCGGGDSKITATMASFYNNTSLPMLIAFF